MKKILIVVESIDVNDSSATKGRLALIQNLHSIGCELKIYHYTRKNISIKGLDTVAIKEQRFTLNYILSKFQVLLWRWFKWNINPFFEKLFGFSFSYFNDVYSIKKALLKENTFNPDYVLTLSKAASFRVHKALLGIIKWHDKWLAYVHDPFPFHFYPRPYNWVEPGYYQKQEFFRAVSKKCKHAIFPSKLLKEWMGSYYPDFLTKGIIIPHQINATNVQINETPQYFQRNKFTILHAGSLMKQRDPRGLIEGYQKFLEDVPEARSLSQLLCIGSKSYHYDYFQSMKEHLPQLYLSEGYVPYADVISMQYHCSVNVILEAKAEISPFLPGKFPHCVNANKPILHLGPSNSECVRLLGQDYPYTSVIDNTELITELITALYHRWKNEEGLFNLNRPDIKSYLSVAYLAEAIQNLE